MLDVDDLAKDTRVDDVLDCDVVRRVTKYCVREPSNQPPLKISMD
jgi:hypothetical protein